MLGEKRAQHKPWITQESLELVEKRRKKKQHVNESKTRSQKMKAQKDYNDVAKEVKRSLQKVKETYITVLKRRQRKQLTMAK